MQTIYRITTYIETGNDYLDSKPINGGSTWGLVKLHLWCLSPWFWALFQEKQWQPLMSNWPLLFVSLSFTFHICLWCGPWWQQTALLSILNFCSELQHLSLGSCVMVSIWKFFTLNCLFSFSSHRWILFWLTPPHTHTQLFWFTVNCCTPLSNIFLKLESMSLKHWHYPQEQEEKNSVVGRVWFCLTSDVIRCYLWQVIYLWISL